MPPRKKVKPQPPGDVPQRDEPEDYKINESPAYTLNLCFFKMNGKDQLQGAALLLTLILIVALLASFFFDSGAPSIKEVRPFLISLVSLTIGVAIGRQLPDKKGD